MVFLNDHEKRSSKSKTFGRSKFLTNFCPKSIFTKILCFLDIEENTNFPHVCPQVFYSNFSTKRPNVFRPHPKLFY